MRVNFNYDTAQRLDWEVDAYSAEKRDRRQAWSAKFNRLLSVDVDVWSQHSSSWQHLRKYTLTQHYVQGNKRLLLDSIAHQGQNGTDTLQTHSFTYHNADLAGRLNNILLHTADNGWGGKVTYNYAGYRADCSKGLLEKLETLDVADCVRHGVTEMLTEDGLGQTNRVTYYLGEIDDPNASSRLAKMDENNFYGFTESKATFYDEDGTTVIYQDHHEF